MEIKTPIRNRAAESEQGFLLVAMIFAVAVILIFLAVAAPVVAKDLQREKELETVHRGNEYVRAIRLYYRKNGQYPTSIDALVQSNNIRYLRQKWTDPMTGKDDWRIIHVGENKTTVTGFFGEPLAGLTTSGGLGSANGMVSSVGGAAGANGSTGTNGAAGSTGGMGSIDASDLSGGGGPIMGVSSLSPKSAIIEIRKQTTYDTWEFIYDPKIEALYKGNIMGGGVATASGGNSITGASGPTSSSGPTASTGP